MTDEDLRRLRFISDAATPDPWLLSETSGCVETTQIGGDGIIYGGRLWSPDFDEDDSPETRVDYLRRDGSFIAAARSAVPALLDEVEQLREQLSLVSSLLAESARLAKDVAEAPEFLEAVKIATSRERTQLRAALAEAIDIFEATWCPEHGHAPKQKQLDRVAELRKLVQS